MKFRITSALLAGILVVPVLAVAQETAVELEYLTLRPPTTELVGAQTVAVIDFQIVGRTALGLHAGMVLADALTAALTNERRIRRSENWVLSAAAEVTEDAVEGLLRFSAPESVTKGLSQSVGGLFGGGDDEEKKKRGEPARRDAPLEIGWTTTRVFEVTDRSAVVQASNQLGVAQGVALAAEQQRTMGERLGAAAIIGGTITRLDDARDSRFSQGRENCFQRNVIIRVSMQVVETSSGLVLSHPEAVEQTVTDQACGNNGYQNLKAHEELLDDAIDAAADRLADEISPYLEAVPVKLVEIVGDGSSEAEEAAELVVEGDLATAYILYAGLMENDAFNPELAYNVGALNEVVGNFGAAAERYRYAAGLDANSELYQDAVARAEMENGRRQMWIALGMDVQDVAWPDQASGAAAEAGDQVMTAADRSDRHTVYASPDTESVKIAEIPGGLTLTLASRSESGDWLEVELPDGSRGWLQRASVN